MADVNEQMDAMLGSSYSEDTTTSMPSGFEKMQRRLREADKIGGEVFTDKEDADKKLDSTIRGIGVGTAAIPSDVVTIAKEGTDFISKDPTMSAMFPTASGIAPSLKILDKYVGRPAFDELLNSFGIESDASDPYQIVGEIISPAGILTKPSKLISKLSGEAKKIFDEIANTFSNSNLVTEGADISTIKKTANIDNITDINKPIINLNEVGLNTEIGRIAAGRYRDLEKKSLGNADYSPEKYKNLDNAAKDELYQQTGMYRGRDGKLRYKIPTADAQINNGYLKESKILDGENNFNTDYIPSEGLSLKEVLNFEDLYRQYRNPKSNKRQGVDPKGTQFQNLEDIKVKNFDAYIDQMKLTEQEATKLKSDGTQAIYSVRGTTETIYVSSGSLDKVRSDILHEVQHAIQRREGFASGGSPDVILGSDYKLDVGQFQDDKKLLLEDFTKKTDSFKYDGISYKFDDNKKSLFETATDKLAEREFSYMYSDGKAGTRNLFKERMPDRNGVYKVTALEPTQSYKIRDVVFNEQEAALINSLAGNSNFIQFMQYRAYLERVSRNLEIKEQKAVIEYKNLAGEQQARKVQEDDVLYNNTVKFAIDKGLMKPGDKLKKENIDALFRTFRPSEFDGQGVLYGQDAVQGKNLDIQANVKE